MTTHRLLHCRFLRLADEGAVCAQAAAKAAAAAAAAAEAAACDELLSAVRMVRDPGSEPAQLVAWLSKHSPPAGKLGLARQLLVQAARVGRADVAAALNAFLAEAEALPEKKGSPGNLY
jgi:hypothetical protein